MRYIVDVSDREDIIVDLDDPDYDGPEDSVNEPDGIYHVEALSESEAIQIALDLDELFNISCEHPDYDEAYYFTAEA